MKTTRREFLSRSSLTALSMALGSAIPFGELIPKGWIPVALAAGSGELIGLKGTEGLTLLADRPLNAETPMHLLDEEVTPTSRLYIRNNGLLPEIARTGNAGHWTLTIDGEIKKSLVLSLPELKSKFKNYTYQLVIECAGNGRAAFLPHAPGNQWTYGGVGCPLWTGVRLKDVLNEAGLKPTAIYTGYYGLDQHLSGDPEKVVISRGTPIAKALDDYTLIAFEMNGKPLSGAHGFPARLVCPGYPASASGKWLKRITIRDRVHDGEKMNGLSYRLPHFPVQPGSTVPPKDMDILEHMPVKSIITFPRSGTSIKEADRKEVSCRGFAWTGDKEVTDVDVSFDFGQTWIPTKLKSPRNPFAWQRWEARFALPSRGYFEIWSRAKDTTGKMQPMVVPGWNPEGYVNNAMPRIAITVI